MCTWQYRAGQYRAGQYRAGQYRAVQGSKGEQVGYNANMFPLFGGRGGGGDIANLFKAEKHITEKAIKTKPGKIDYRSRAKLN